MNFDPNNKIIKLCAEGMNLEGQGKPAEALALFSQAWDEASNNFEKFTAAHYVARHQTSVADKLDWDERALQLALKIDDSDIKKSLPSLYLNVAKGYEDLGDAQKAKENYETALSFANNLEDDSYGKMIKGGIKNGLERLANSDKNSI